jgi:hypothetical protein
VVRKPSIWYSVKVRVCTFLPAERMMRVADSAGCLLPDTGASRKSPPLAATACSEGIQMINLTDESQPKQDHEPGHVHIFIFKQTRFLLREQQMTKEKKSGTQTSAIFNDVAESTVDISTYPFPGEIASTTPPGPSATCIYDNHPKRLKMLPLAIMLNKTPRI